MKKILLYALALSLCITSLAQNEGVITFEETVKFTMEVPPEFADMIPKERKRKTILLFNSTESIYKNSPEEANAATDIEANHGSSGMRMRFMSRNSDNETYKNIEQGINIEKQEFFGREFRINGAEKISWKMTGEQKRIGEFVCMKATYMRDTIPVTAWFTPQIPVSNGPGNYGQLPGMILEVNINNGTSIITATNVSLRPLTSEEKIAAPEKGKELTREEFNQIREEKMAEMREMGGGRGNIIIRGN